MNSKKTEEIITLQRKIKVLKKLYGMGCKTEKALLSLTMLDVLNIENISIQDIAIILAMQKHVKRHTLFSYLSGADCDEDKTVSNSENHA